MLLLGWGFRVFIWGRGLIREGVLIWVKGRGVGVREECEVVD